MQRNPIFRFITLVVACLLLLASSQTALTAPNQTTRASVASDGEQANNDSLHSIISADGRFVAFQSMATNLVAGDTNGSQDIFVHDRQTGETTRVSVASDGVQGNDSSVVPTISADGRYVAFQSYATNLVSGDTNGVQDIFVHDRTTQTTTRISVDSDGVPGNDWSNTPAISGDGRLIAFRSTATNLAPNDTNGKADIFVHNLESRVTTCVSVNANDEESNGYSAEPVISEDGRFVAFSSYATNLVLEDINFASNIFVHDLQTHQTTHVSVGPDGMQGDGNADEPTISADGRFVAFSSVATNLVSEDSNGSQDIFVHDRQTGETTLASVNSSGVQSDRSSSHPAISGDGRFVAFSSSASNLAAEDINESDDVFVHNRQTSETLRASVASDGTQGDGRSTSPSISSNGHYVVINSNATNLVPNDTNDKWDIIVRGLPYPEVTVEQAPGQLNPTADSPINFTVTFTKPIDTATFDGSNVLLGGTAGPTSAALTQVAPNDGTTFNITVSGMSGYGTVTVSILTNMVEDLDGYTIAANTSTDNEVSYLAPLEVTLEQTSDQPDPTNQSPIHYTATFTKHIDTATFDGSDVLLGGTAGATTATVTQIADGITFNIAVSGMTGYGTVTASLPPGLVTSQDGILNSASTSTDNITIYDPIAPTVTINQANNQADPTNINPILFIATFSKAIEASTFENSDVSIGGTAEATTALVTEITPNDGTTFNIAINGMTAYGTVIVSLPTGAVQDLAGNDNIASTNTDNEVSYTHTILCFPLFFR